ncbi:LytTR family DNA-binding domain-containing protein [Blautia argi]
MHAVKEYKPLGGGLMLAEFENGDAAYLSRKYVKELRENGSVN